MALYYGLRRGEAIGLKWDSADFKNDKIKINHIVTQTLTLVAKDKTKTASSKREYHLLPEIKEMLKIILAEQKKNKKLFGKSYQVSVIFLKVECIITSFPILFANSISFDVCFPT